MVFIILNSFFESPKLFSLIIININLLQVVHLWRHFQKALSIPSTQKWLETQFWKCKSCPEELQGLKAFWEHLEVEHGIVELLCPGCEKTGFPDKQTLRRHVKTYHGVKLPCEFCGKFFNEGNKMRRHVIEGKWKKEYKKSILLRIEQIKH